ncbi:DUF7660 family protein [Microbulbifer okhotskensis]|uniref:DUF7660 family protein n=1 Tax=Microbulbifer okhotskensis TaxID=2926617 RepID=UPI00403875F3
MQEERNIYEHKIKDGTEVTEDWANNSISEYLESACSWAEDSSFGVDQDPELKTNKWKQFAVFLYCGKIYE